MQLYACLIAVGANNSFKPRPLRGLGAGSYDSAIAVAATLPGLTQALAAVSSDIAVEQ